MTTERDSGSPASRPNDPAPPAQTGEPHRSPAYSDKAYIADLEYELNRRDDLARAAPPQPVPAEPPPKPTDVDLAAAQGDVSGAPAS
jgi:hypothetical protein